LKTYCGNFIEELSRIAGPRWYKTRLPADVFKKYSESLKFVRTIRWTKVIPHHPIYYTDFGDLRKIVERADNWNDIFSSLFGRKEFMLTLFGELETVRNTTAHNRKNSDLDLQLVSSALEQLRTILGSERFATLELRFTGLSSIKDLLSELQSEGTFAAEACFQCKPLEALPAWVNAERSWWFDDDYLEADLASVRQYFISVSQYISLPRYRGSGHHLEEWVRSSSLNVQFVASDSTLRQLLLAVS
jgi:hypothetical protein